MAEPAVFKLNPVIDLATPDVFGMWQAAPDAGGAVAFDMSAVPPGEDTTVWQVDLSGDPLETRARLDSGLARLDSTPMVLPGASRKFEALARQIMFEGMPSFDLQEIPRSEAEALRLLQYTSQPDLIIRAAPEEPGVEFALGLPGKQDLIDAAAQVQAFTGQVRQTISQFALVQSVIDGEAFAATRVAWLGDFSSGWSSRLNPEQAAQHAQAVRTALTTRRHWLRIAMFISAGAVKVGAAAGSGVGILVAAAAAYRFIKLVIDEYQELKQEVN